MNRYKAAFLVLLALTLAAWDTRVVEGEIWRSTYFRERSASIPEHTDLANLALQELGVAEILGKHGSAGVTVVDLNATYFREEVMRGSPREGDDSDTEVEERLLPQPARFAGLPDYSYGPADWLNKNRTCPIGGPARNDELCHEFLGWLGGLNSVHFGSQATAMYTRYHAIALQRADRAKQMREAMTPEERQVYAHVLREAEHQALIYEGYAQHFLQDRWAIGHMWERWDGPDRTQLANASVWSSLVIGAVAGLIHGTEALVTANLGQFGRDIGLAADPMSSPLPGDDAARPMTFRHVENPDTPPIPAVGDERLGDLVRGSFGAGYGGEITDQPLDVAVQRKELLTCSKAGWAEVIRALGQGPNGGYGEYGIRLSADAPDFAVVDQAECWDMWATNRSMYVGLVYLGSLGANPEGERIVFAGLAVLQAVVPGGVPFDGTVYSSTDLPALAWRMWRRQLVDPDGTDLARGGIGALFNAPTGEQASLPVYAEPIDPSALPTEATGGVDRQTIFGAMPWAHSDYWGGIEGLELLERLRRSDRASLQQACQFVADMAWQGTHPGYTGRMSRTRIAEGVPVRSLGHIRTGHRERESDDPADPFYIDQGYVSRTEAEDQSPTFGSKSVANWCARVPIVRLSRDPELRNQNIIQVLASDATRLELIGQDFGAKEGNVFIYEEGRARRALGRILEWEDRRIGLTFQAGELMEGRDYLVEIGTFDGKSSVGLFILRIRPDEAEPEPPPPVISASCDAPPPPVPTFDMSAAISRQVGPDWNRVDPAELAAAIRAARAELTSQQAKLREFLLAERACILEAMPAGISALESIENAGRLRAEREAAAHYERTGSPGGSKQCAFWTGGDEPIGYLFEPRPPAPPEDIWSPYIDEIDGVIQVGLFAEAHAEAMALAVERRASPVRRGGDFDLRITDPAELLDRHYTATDPVTSRFYNPPLSELSVMHSWSAVALGLYGVTAEGIVNRRAYERWVTVDAALSAEDALDALCRIRNPITSSGFSVSFAPLSGFGFRSDTYWRGDGQRYDRIGWPSRPSESSPPDPSFEPVIIRPPSVPPAPN